MRGNTPSQSSHLSSPRWRSFPDCDGPEVVRLTISFGAVILLPRLLNLLSRFFTLTWPPFSPPQPLLGIVFLSRSREDLSTNCLGPTHCLYYSATHVLRREYIVRAIPTATGVLNYPDIFSSACSRNSVNARAARKSTVPPFGLSPTQSVVLVHNTTWFDKSRLALS
jgi:hypothetical protein